MMIKHQTELVNVANLNCPLHGAELDKSEIKERLNNGEQEHINDIALPSKNYFDDNLIKTEAICLCGEKTVDESTTNDVDEQLCHVKL